MTPAPEHLDEPIMSYVRTDYATLREDMTAQQALDTIRIKGVGEKIVYFYITDKDERLVGVLPTRRLLMTPPDARISDFMLTRVITIPHTATVMDACEYFILHKYFAFPVVDAERRVVGLVDVGLFTEEVFDVAERGQMDDVFEAIGFKISQVRDCSPVKAFRYRFPWLLSTIGSGTICALVSGMFQTTLEQSIVLAFFLTLVLGLGESVSIQSMTVTIQALRTTKPTIKWYLGALRKEVAAASMLGLACGSVVAGIVWIWRGQPIAATVVGGSIFVSITLACLTGLSIPAFLHALKLDPKIAAGPITLALADIMTLLFYMTLATVVLSMRGSLA